MLKPLLLAKFGLKNYLDSDAGPIEVVAVQALDDVVDFRPAGVGVDVNEAVILDDVSLEHWGERLEKLPELIEKFRNIFYNNDTDALSPELQNVLRT